MRGLRYAPEINGVVYNWMNLKVNIAGVVVTGITQISYKDSQAISNIYGAGQYPVGRGYGKIEPTASITLLRGEVESIRESSSTGRLQDIDPFDIIVQFTSPDSLKIVTHTLRDVQFKDDGVDIKEGNTSDSAVFALIVSKIEWKK